MCRRLLPLFYFALFSKWIPPTKQTWCMTLDSVAFGIFLTSQWLPCSRKQKCCPSVFKHNISFVLYLSHTKQDANQLHKTWLCAARYRKYFAATVQFRNRYSLENYSVIIRRSRWIFPLVCPLQSGGHYVMKGLAGINPSILLRVN